MFTHIYFPATSYNMDNKVRTNPLYTYQCIKLAHYNDISIPKVLPSYQQSLELFCIMYAPVNGCVLLVKYRHTHTNTMSKTRTYAQLFHFLKRNNAIFSAKHVYRNSALLFHLSIPHHSASQLVNRKCMLC